MLRVTCVIASLGPGGAERVLSEIANGLGGMGLLVTVITLDQGVPDHYRLDGSVQRISISIFWPSASKIRSLLSTVQRLALIRRTVMRSRPDAVLSFGDLTNIRIVFALLGTGVPVVASERVDPRMHCIGRSWGALRRLAYRRARCVVVQTDSVARWAKEFLRSDAVKVIPNFARTFASAKGASRERVVLGVGRLDPQKGFDMLIEAFRLSGLGGHGWRLVIVGEGSQRPTLEAQIRAAGLAETVELPGNASDVGLWYARASIFVLSSRYEGFPNVLLEAMSCGLACIAFDCPSGPADVIQPGRNGLLVAPNDVVALSSAVAMLAADAGLRCGLAESAHRVDETFSRAAILGRWKDLLHLSARR